jgi:hypothetical protein
MAGSNVTCQNIDKPMDFMVMSLLNNQHFNNVIFGDYEAKQGLEEWLT